MVVLGTGCRHVGPEELTHGSATPVPPSHPPTPWHATPTPTPPPPGVRTRPPRARSALLQLAEASRYPVAVLPDAKGFFPEDHPHYIGMYWGAGGVGWGMTSGTARECGGLEGRGVWC